MGQSPSSSVALPCDSAPASPPEQLHDMQQKRTHGARGLPSPTRARSPARQRSNSRSHGGLHHAAHSLAQLKRDTVQHIEVIGGSSTLAPLRACQLPPPRVRQCLGRAKLPVEVRRQIYAVLARDLLQAPSAGGALLNLALVEPASRIELLALRMASIDLHGASRARLLSQLVRQAGPVRQLAESSTSTIRLLQEDVSPCSPQAPFRALRRGLYDASAATRTFETATSDLGLHHFQRVEKLVLECSPLLLLPEAMWRATAAGRKREAGLRKVRGNVRDLVSMLSLWGGGDGFEGLWRLAGDRDGAQGGCSNEAVSPGVALPRPFGNLTHLQLHGPRMRFTPQTALALAELPALSHLAIILPRFIPQDALAPIRFDGRPVHAVDALGRVSVLQVLVNAAVSLRHIYLIGHGSVGYSGNVLALPSQVAAVERRPYDWAERRAAAEAVCGHESPEPLPDIDISVITASRTSANGPHDRTHPTYYSRWMYARACKELHWALIERPDDAEGKAIDRLWHVDYTVETIRLKVHQPLEERPRTPSPPSPVHHSQANDSSFMLGSEDAPEVD